jgi:hypothetical protein
MKHVIILQARFKAALNWTPNRGSQHTNVRGFRL